MRTSYAATIHDYNILILCNKMVSFFIGKVRFSTSMRLNGVVTCIVMYIWCGCVAGRSLWEARTHKGLSEHTVIGN